MQTDGAVTELVICADDYAMTPEISAGILALAQQGHISATSAMTLSPHWPQWARQVAALQQQIDVGLHLDWTSEFAVQQGFGLPLGRLMVLCSLRQLRRQDLQDTIERQLELFEQHSGCRPDHVDGHQHVQQFPLLREALVDVLCRRYAQHERPWLRVSEVLCRPWDIKARAINAMGAAALKKLAQQRGLMHSQHLTGVYGFDGDAGAYRQRLHQWLAQVPPATVLMCHPAQAPRPESPLAQARQQEQAVLGQTSLPGLLREHKVRLARGSRLFAPLVSQRA